MRRAARHGWDAGAVVLGGDFQGLGIVRSLARRGVDVVVLDDEFSIARFSRHTRRTVRAGALRDEQVIVDELLRLADRGGLEGWVLYPTREEMVAAISRHRTTLAQRYRVPTPPWQAVSWVWDKRNTYRLADSLGIPTPRTWCPRDAGELSLVEGDGPWALKPAIKEHFIYETKAKAWRADDRRALAGLFARTAAFMAPGEMMVQELVPGDGRHQYAYCALFKDGHALASMVARRRRQHPPEFGRASTFVETVDEPALAARSQRLLRAMDFYGLVEVEYKLDPRDGEYKLLDVNARTWGYHTLGASAGVDFPYLLFADQLGRDVPRSSASSGVRWVRLLTDVPTAVDEIRRGRLTVRDYLASLRGCETEAVLSRDDPLPFLAEVALLPYLILKRGF
jgi:predicted ATP-grasp superfamily ATP-dependent carboligase